MEIILLERIERLGQMGDVVNVKPGFARNFLLPQKKALRATKANLALFESQRKEIEARNLAAKSEAEAVAAKLEGKSVTLLRQAGESGQLYGSATTKDIAEALSEDGVKIVRSQIILSGPIKELGVHEVVVRLHAEVSVKVKANVARSDEEAEIQIAEQTAEAAADVFESEELAEAAVEELTAPAASEEAPAEEASEDASDEGAGEEAPAEDSADAENAGEEEKAE